MRETSKSMIKAVDMPEDLVAEIFSRVPAASLPRFRSISKGCNALINDEGFAKKHVTNAPRPSLVIMLIDSRAYSARVDLTGRTRNNLVVKEKEKGRLSLRDPLSKHSKQVGIRNLFHCDGLLLCTTKDNRLAVWNPVTGQTKWIPPGVYFKYFEFCVLVKSSTSNQYKILKLDDKLCTSYMQRLEVECEIYDFISNSWRVCRESTDWSIDRTMIDRGGVSLEGNTYWLGRKENMGIHVETILICFDFSIERFRCASLPGDQCSYNAFALSVDREGKHLCMLATKRGGAFDIDVWVATEIGEATSWSKFILVPARAYRKHNVFFSWGINFLVDVENKVIVCRGRDGFLNIVGESTFIKVDHHHHDDEKSKCSLLINYLPSLVQIQDTSEA